MTCATPDQARVTWPCPIARLWADVAGVNAMCRGDGCPLWRKKPLTTDAAWKRVVQAEAARTGERPPYPKAAKAVASEPEAHGVETTLGFCGMGGKP